MKKRGFVTLWMGESESEESLEEYVLLKYSEDGDVIPSHLMKDFSISTYDEGVREAEHLGETNGYLKSILEGFSYDDRVIREFSKICGEKVDFKVNSAVLLYDFEADCKRGETAHHDDVHLRLMGSVEYGIL